MNREELWIFDLLEVSSDNNCLNNILSNVDLLQLSLFCFLKVLHCKCKVDTMTFPVTVTQQSPAAVSMETYQITIEPMIAMVC